MVFTLPRHLLREYQEGAIVLRNGTLWHARKHAYLIPKTLRYDFLDYFHCALTNLHQGFQRMRGLMENRVFWHGMIRTFGTFCMIVKLV